MAARNARMIEDQGYLGAIAADNRVAIEQQLAWRGYSFRGGGLT